MSCIILKKKWSVISKLFLLNCIFYYISNWSKVLELSFNMKSWRVKFRNFLSDFPVHYAALFINRTINNNYMILSWCAPTPPPVSAGGGAGRGDGVEPTTKFSKRGRLDRISVFRGGCLERGGNFFQAGCSFYIKNKLKSEIFNNKNSF